MARRALSAAWRFGAAALASTGLASAASGPSSLSLEASTCDSAWLDQPQLERAIRAELEADGIAVVEQRDARRSDDGSLSVRVACQAAGSASVTLYARASNRRREQSVTLADTDAASRPRVLALAVSELVRSGWPSLSEASATIGTAADESGILPDGATVPAASAPASSASAPKSRALGTAPALVVAPAAQPSSNASSPRADTGIESHQPRSHWAPHAALSAKARWFVDYSSVSWGGDAGADFGALRLRAEALFTSQQDPLGAASLGSAALCVGYRVFDVRWGAFAFTGYPLAAAGVTWLRGESHSTEIRTEPATGFYGDLRFSLQAALNEAKLSPNITLEVGRATGFVARAGDRSLGANGGTFLGASAGARY